MSRVGRLAGAILAESEGIYYLVGNLKEPCDFPAQGFESPGELDASVRPYVRLQSVGSISLQEPCLRMDLESEALAKLLARLFLIERNGSVSDRLWSLVVGENCSANEIDAGWLEKTPIHIWQVVRATVLKCS